MNMIEVQDALKNFSKDQLIQEMQMPTGNVPQFMVLSELTRRQKMEQDFASQGQDTGTTVAEEAVSMAGMPAQAGRQMAQSMAPKTSMSQNTGQMQAQGMRGMQAGGPVSYFGDFGMERYDPRGPDSRGNYYSKYGVRLGPRSIYSPDFDEMVAPGAGTAPQMTGLEGLVDRTKPPMPFYFRQPAPDGSGIAGGITSPPQTAPGALIDLSDSGSARRRDRARPDLTGQRAANAGTSAGRVRPEMDGLDLGAGAGGGRRVQRELPAMEGRVYGPSGVGSAGRAAGEPGVGGLPSLNNPFYMGENVEAQMPEDPYVGPMGMTIADVARSTQHPEISAVGIPPQGSDLEDLAVSRWNRGMREAAAVQAVDTGNYPGMENRQGPVIARNIYETERGDVPAPEPEEATPWPFTDVPYEEETAGLAPVDEEVEPVGVDMFNSISDWFTRGPGAMEAGEVTEEEAEELDAATTTALEPREFEEATQIFLSQEGPDEEGPVDPNTARTAVTAAGAGSSPIIRGATNSEADRILQERLAALEEQREQDKYLSLAKFGLALMQGGTGTIGGDIGQAGQFALEDFQASQRQLQDDEDAIEDTMIQIAMQREKMAQDAAMQAARIAASQRAAAAKGTNPLAGLKSWQFDIRAAPIEGQIRSIDNQIDTLTEQGYTVEDENVRLLEQRKQGLYTDLQNLATRYQIPAVAETTAQE